MTVIHHYETALRGIPPPGKGCHPALLSVANWGVKAGLPKAQIHEDIRASIPPGRRKVTDREISDAVSKAINGSSYRPRPKPTITDGAAVFRRIIEGAEISDPMDLMEASPIRLLNPVSEDALTFLEIMFKSGDLVFIGGKYDDGVLGQTIRYRDDWIRHLEAGRPAGPSIIVNPLSGKPSPKKFGDGETLRGDACVEDFRHVLVEFDSLDHESQIRFWSAVRLPIKALINSGNKSIHAWLDVQKLAEIATSEQWDTHIKGRLFDRNIVPLGVDSVTGHPARLARLPGVRRGENWQRVLWLSHKGRFIDAP